jgi:membrane protein implicated in regulation of membrane protease activity
MASNCSDKTKRAKIMASRRGIVLVAVVAVFAISLMLFALWARVAVGQQRQMRNQQYRAQAVRLAEAGVRRAIARRSADAQYADEVWRIPAELLDQKNSGQVRIQVTDDGGETIKYEATAEFPDGTVHRARITRRVEIPRPNPESES